MSEWRRRNPGLPAARPLSQAPLTRLSSGWTKADDVAVTMAHRANTRRFSRMGKGFARLPWRSGPRPPRAAIDVAEVRDLLADSAGIVRSVGFRDRDGERSCVVGIGSDAWGVLFAGSRPAELHPFREIAGSRHVAVSTPGDLLFHMRARRMDLRFELAGQLAERSTMTHREMSIRAMKSRNV